MNTLQLEHKFFNFNNVEREVSEIRQSDLSFFLRVIFNTPQILRDVEKLNSDLEFIKNNFTIYTKEEGKDSIAIQHKDLKESIDRLIVHLPSLKEHWFTKRLFKSLSAFLENAKEVELKFREYAYPEYNTFRLTYDQLRELNSEEALSIE